MRVEYTKEAVKQIDALEKADKTIWKRVLRKIKGIRDGTVPKERMSGCDMFKARV